MAKKGVNIFLLQEDITLANFSPGRERARFWHFEHAERFPFLSSSSTQGCLSISGLGMLKKEGKKLLFFEMTWSF